MINIVISGWLLWCVVLKLWPVWLTGGQGKGKRDRFAKPPKHYPFHAVSVLLTNR